jgi:hypothetical protein
MSEASDKLARTRNALVAQMAQRQRRHDPREVPASAPAPSFEATAYAEDFEDDEDLYEPGSGWFGHLRHALHTWWRYHPAHMAVDLASPFVRDYARQRPAQLLGISFVAGAGLMFLRPWRLISVGGIAWAVLKSSQLSQLAMAALSATDLRKGRRRRR